MIGSSPTYDVAPPFFVSCDWIYHLDQIDPNHMVESIGFRDCCRAPGGRPLVGLTFCTPEVFPYPCGDLWATVAPAEESGEIHI